MIRTRITELFGLRYPIIQAGMVWNSGWRPAAAGAGGGGLRPIGGSPHEAGLLPGKNP